MRDASASWICTVVAALKNVKQQLKPGIKRSLLGLRDCRLSPRLNVYLLFVLGGNVQHGLQTQLTAAGAI